MRPSILLSYYFWQRADLDALLRPFPERPVVFADSGAFSADTVGASIDVDAYAAWLDRWRSWIDVACTLDVIGDAAGTWANTQRLQEHGHRVLPVFHVGEEWEWLERYCEAYPYVGLGGQVPFASQPDRVLRWLVRCMQIGRAHGTVFHGLGQTNPRTLAALPFYSVDSSTWVWGERYGALMLWDDQRGKLVTITKASTENRRAVRLNGDLVRAHGLTTEQATDPAFARPAPHKTPVDVAAERSVIRHANLAAWLRLAAWWARRHGAVRLDGMPDGPLLFLVCAGTEQVRGVLDYVLNNAPAAADA